MVINDPMFTQFPEHDAAVSSWFETNGWPITIRHYDFDRAVFAWRHEALGIERTLRATMAVLEDWPGGRCLKHVARNMRHERRNRCLRHSDGIKFELTGVLESWVGHDPCS